MEALRTEPGLTGLLVVLFLGSLSPTSHPVDLLTGAFARLSREMPETRLLIVGGGEGYESLQQRACAAGIGECTVFAGRVAPDRAVDYYRLAPVSVDPVHDDPVARARSPLKLFKSWAAGTAPPGWVYISVMRIAFLLSQSLESPSGLGRYWPISKELVRLGHRVTILALHHNLNELSQRRFFKEGVDVHYVGQMHVRKEGSRKFYFSPGRLLVISLASALSLARGLAQLDADVVHLCKPQPINGLAVQLGRRGRPVFCDCDDYEAQTNRFSGEWQRRIVQHFEDDIMRYAAGLTVNTHFTLKRYRGLGFPEQRIVYVPNGVDRARFAGLADTDMLRRRWGLDKDDPLIVYVGTLGLQSHPIDLLLEAFQRVEQCWPTARLLLVGGGEDYDKLKELTQQLGIAERAIFTGRVPPEDVPGYFALATVSVDPVRDDLIARARSPLKVLESLVMGVPVVTGDVGDRGALLEDGELGVLVSPGDSQALADGLLAVLQDPNARARMTQAALARREQWYWDRLVNDFVQVYENEQRIIA